jgi:hypothetical protein
MTASWATWRARHFISIIAKGRPPVGRLDERALGGSERIKASGRAEAFVSLAVPAEIRAPEEMEPVEA